MKIKKMALEIILIILAGLITLVLSVNSIVKADKQEAELKESQKELNNKSDSIIALQREMQNKSNQIIELQNQLISSSSSQLENITRLRNPIPTELQISFTSQIIIKQGEVLLIDDALKHTRGDRGNTLPTEFKIKNDGTDRIDKLKDILFTLNIEFINGEKRLKIKISKTPNYFGYHPTNLTNNCFMLALMREKASLEFNGFTLYTNEVSCNYNPASIIDFNSSKVLISYSFSYPKYIVPGDLTHKAYMSDNRDYMKLEMRTVTIHARNYRIDLDNLKKVDDFTYQTNYNNNSL